MQITHIALWVKDLELMRQFYEKYLNAASNKKYENPVKGFESYFLNFAGNCCLELMKKHTIRDDPPSGMEYKGFAHLAFSAGSQEHVDILTNRLRSDGYTLLDEPRRTGDGYYESVALDPEGNRIEITE